MTKIPVAVLAATGTVGQRFISLLDGHPMFELAFVGASPANAGKRFDEATTWRLPGAIPKDAAKLVLGNSLDVPDSVRVVFSALPTGQAGPIERELAGRGFAVFTNTSDLRMAPDVPLLIPELNGHELAPTSPGFVVANGNCSGIILSMALAPLRQFGLQSATVTTMQAISGAGYPGVSSFEILDNIVPLIENEEEKLREEPSKTLGHQVDIWPTCTRVPVQDGHFMVIQATCAQELDINSLKLAFNACVRPDNLAAAPSAPERYLQYCEDPARPQPKLDRDAGAGMTVSVGRLELGNDTRTVRYIALGHNTIRGAAGQSILNAEFAQLQGFLA